MKRLRRVTEEEGEDRERREKASRGPHCKERGTMPSVAPTALVGSDPYNLVSIC